MKRCEPGDYRSSSSSSMERSAGPRIYVPLSMPEISQPTYAVLEFVGFSSPAANSIPRPIPTTPPAMLCLPPVLSSSSSLVPSNPTTFFPLNPLAPPNHSLTSNLPTISQYAESKAFPMPTPSTHGFLHHSRPNHGGGGGGGERLEVVNLDSPPSSPSSIAPSSASSVSRQSKERNPLSINISHVVKPMGSSVVNGMTPAPSSCASASTSPTGLSKPMVNFNSSSSSEGGFMQTKISVSQTERETIVHTHSSNFRDVVRQLTGASSNDQDLLPVTLPARLANRVNNTINSTNAEVSAGNKTVSELGLRKAPLKLHERRKSSMKNLEKLSTAFHAELSPLNPSPVTPLASDFERFCNATTPTSQGNSALNSPKSLINKAKPNIDCVNIIVERSADHHQAISETSFYLQHPPARPSAVEKISPTLLNLFPESPICSPRDR